MHTWIQGTDDRTGRNVMMALHPVLGVVARAQITRGVSNWNIGPLQDESCGISVNGHSPSTDLAMQTIDTLLDTIVVVEEGIEEC